MHRKCKTDATKKIVEDEEVDEEEEDTDPDIDRELKNEIKNIFKKTIQVDDLEAITEEEKIRKVKEALDRIVAEIKADRTNLLIEKSNIETNKLITEISNVIRLKNVH